MEKKDFSAKESLDKMLENKKLGFNWKIWGAIVCLVLGLLYVYFLSDRVMMEEYEDIIIWFFIAAMALGAIWPGLGKEKIWMRSRLFQSYLEVYVIAACFALGFGYQFINILIDISEYQLGSKYPSTLTFYINAAIYAVYFFIPWFFGIALRVIPEMGIRNYFFEKVLLVKFGPVIWKRLHGVQTEVEHFDITKNANKLIIKVALLNGLLGFILFNLGNPLTAFILSGIIVYLVLRIYVSKLQSKYAILLEAVNQMADGNIDVTIEQDMGVFEPFKPELLKISAGFRKALTEEVKSERMKTELITNVSHDLKTPLTAIITYINLLKNENNTKEQQREYLDTLERKSLRLKALIEDLFEVSKATSKSVKLDLMQVNLVSLMKQASLETAEAMQKNDIDVRTQYPEDKVILTLDSAKTYRIYENLLNNVAKYAMPHTRVYISVSQTPVEVVTEIKNITAQEINMKPEELMERFVRGDLSRNTEGSGLGLAIAKSFTELQGGKMEILLDGDLFKVVTTWKK